MSFNWIFNLPFVVVVLFADSRSGKGVQPAQEVLDNIRAERNIQLVMGKGSRCETPSSGSEDDDVFGDDFRLTSGYWLDFSRPDGVSLSKPNDVIPGEDWAINLCIYLLSMKRI